MSGRKAIVCGGRDYDDREAIATALSDLHGRGKFDELLLGGATGADAMAKAWADFRGVKFTEHRADWDAHGKSAGPRRNRAMLDAGASLVVAFPGGRGTSDMVRQAEARGVEVIFPVVSL